MGSSLRTRSQEDRIGTSNSRNRRWAKCLREDHLRARVPPDPSHGVHQCRRDCRRTRSVRAARGPAPSRTPLLPADQRPNRAPSQFPRRDNSGGQGIPEIRATPLSGQLHGHPGLRVPRFPRALPRSCATTRPQGRARDPCSDVLRRFQRSLENFWHQYRLAVTRWHLVQNSRTSFEEVAIGQAGRVLIKDNDQYQAFF